MNSIESKRAQLNRYTQIALHTLDDPSSLDQFAGGNLTTSMLRSLDRLNASAFVLGTQYREFSLRHDPNPHIRKGVESRRALIAETAYIHGATQKQVHLILKELDLLPKPDVSDMSVDVQPPSSFRQRITRWFQTFTKFEENLDTGIDGIFEER